MDLKIKQTILRNGKRFEIGDVINLPDAIAKVWIKKGFASKKRVKTEVESKEFKIEYIEIKSDATN